MSDNDSGSSNGDGTEQRPIKILIREKSPDNSKELGTKASEQDSSDVNPKTDKKEAETKILKPRPLEAEGGAKSESNGTTSPKAKSKSSAKSKKAEDKDKKNAVSTKASEEIKKLEPDSRGCYSIKFTKPDEKYTAQDIVKEFSCYGEIKDKHVANKAVFVRFATKAAATKALKEHTKRELSVPKVSKEFHKDDDSLPSVYVGSISAQASKDEVKALFTSYNMKDFKFYKIGKRIFAFVFVATAADAKKAIKEVHGRKLKDSTLTVAMAHKKDRTNAISGEEEDRKRETELYIAHFKWGTTAYELRHLLEPFGFKSIRIDTPTDHQGCNKAFAVMWSLDSAMQAISRLNQNMWMGQRLLVTLWHREEQRPYNKEEVLKLQKETESRWRMDADLERAWVLSQRLDAMIDDVIDDCYFCSRVRSNMTELCDVINRVQAMHFQQVHGAKGGDPYRHGPVQPSAGPYAGMTSANNGAHYGALPQYSPPQQLYAGAHAGVHAGAGLTRGGGGGGGGGFASGAFNGSTAFADAMHKSSKLAGAGRGDRIMEPAAFHYAATGGVGRPLGAGRGAAKMRNAYAY